MKSLRKCMFGLLLVGVLGMTSCNDANNSGTKIDITPGSNDVASSHAIINGEPDTNKMHNAVVSLLYEGFHSSCTGTLIHPQWVLTAAHCVADITPDGPEFSSFSEGIKTIGVGHNMEELMNNQYPIDKIYFHEKYGLDPNNEIDDWGPNDIALIKLAEPVPESVAFPIPPLHPYDGITRERIESEGVPVILSGFGLDENNNGGVKLQTSTSLRSYCGASDNDSINGCYYGEVTVTGCHPDPTVCDDKDNAYWCSTGHYCMENAVYSIYLPFGILYYESESGGVCNGDSGGPVLVKTKTFPGIAVAGVSSLVDGACAKWGFHTAVQDFYDSFIMKYAPEVKDYHDAKFFKAVSAANEGYCNEDHFTACQLYNNNEDFVSCSIKEDKSWQCGFTCHPDDSNCSERCNDGVIACDGAGTGLRTCVEGKWSEPELCPMDTPYCNYNRCRASAVDWCTFHWMESSTENSTATGYGRILIPSENPEDIKNAYMACTDDISKPVSEWTRMDAEMNSHCSDCGQNSEYMSSVYQASSNNYYCTFVFEYKDEVIACRPRQNGDSKPIPIKSGTTLGFDDIRSHSNGGTVTIRTMTANITSGSKQGYSKGDGIRIFQALKPDIVMIQEFNMYSHSKDTEDDIRKLVDTAFGPEFNYYQGDGDIPNGIISRYPILDSGYWKSNVIFNRDWNWAVVDIPGPKNLLAVSVHLSTDYNAYEMPVLVNSIKSKLKEDADKGIEYFVMIGGDFNTTNRSDVKSKFADVFTVSAPYPVDQKGNDKTNSARKYPYDYLLCAPDWCQNEIPITIGSHTYNHGHVFDARVYYELHELKDVPPVQVGDSSDQYMQHMAIIRDFKYTY